MRPHLLFAALLVLSASNAVAQSPGDPDNTFGGTGHVLSDLSAQNRYDESSLQVLIQPDGKRVVVVDRYPYIQLIRFNADGTYDNTYGEGGFSQAANINHFSGPNPCGAIQSDGKIVVAGETPWNSTSMTDFGVARWNTDGSLDANFGNQGIVTLDFGNYWETGEAVRIQSDGQIVVAGQVDINNLDLIGLARLNTNGSLDNSYGPAGTGKYVYGTSFDLDLTDLDFTPDGKLMALCDNNDDDFVLVRFGANGVIDTGFGVLGLQTYDLPLGGSGQYHPFVSCMAIQSDGKLLIGGSLYNGVNSDMFVARFTAAGTTDGSFHGSGYQTTHIGGSEDVRDLAVQPDGRILAAGDVFYGSLPTVFALARYMPNGDLDGSFGVQGTQITSFSGYDGAGASAVALHADGDITAAGSAARNIHSDVAVATYDVQGAPDVDGYPVQKIVAFYADDGFTQFRTSAVQADGKLVTAGYTWNGLNYDMVVARFNLDGTPDPTFGSGGSQNVDFSAIQPGSGDELASSIAIQTDGKIVLSGSFFGFTVGSTLPVARLNANGTLDATFGTGGIEVLDLPGVFEEGNGMVIQPDGRIVIAGDTNLYDFDFMLCRLKTNGSLDPTFGTGGVVVTDWGYQDIAFGVVRQPDGKFVATGNTSNKDSFLGFDFNTARFDSNGTLDASFGTGGRVTTDFGGGIDFAQAIALQPNGGLLVAGGVPVNNDFEFGVARYSSTGAPDALFGTGGNTVTALGGYDIANAVGVQKDNKILVAGYTDQSLGYTGGAVDLALVRYSTGGALDPSFGAGGKVVADFNGQEFGFSMGLYKRRIYVTGEQRIYRPYSATDKVTGLVATFLSGPPPADELIGDAGGTIDSLTGVPPGTKQSLHSKLQSALGALAAADTNQACNNLQALVNEIKALTGKKLSGNEAAELLAETLAIMNTLHCSAHNAALMASTDTGSSPIANPMSFSLDSNSPNPFVGTTRINYQLPVPSKVSLRIYNVQGQVVATVIDRVEGPGFKSVSWDASRMPAGVYFARLQAGTFKADRKLLLVR